MKALRARHSMKLSRRVSITSIMTALALVGNYSLAAIPNVELGSTILFTTAFVFGFPMGATCVLLMSIIYASFNPWGPFIPQIWLAQVIGWLFMVMVGAMMAAVGAFTTLFFDLITTLGYSWAFGVPYLVALATGLPFMIIHVWSNAAWFVAVAPGLNSILKTHFQSAIWDEQAELILEISEE
jgi:MFS family permease